MSRQSSRPVTGKDASAFQPANRGNFVEPSVKVCTWGGCKEAQFYSTPVCIRHAMMIASLFNGLVPEVFNEPEDAPSEVFKPRHYVYYLMIGPATVKIGTTRCLPRRLSGLRTDLQYVVAIERGGVQLERSRHLEFAKERIPGTRREDFTLSDRLRAHIESLMETRDEIIEEALTRPYGDMVRKAS